MTKNSLRQKKVELKFALFNNSSSEMNEEH